MIEIKIPEDKSITEKLYKEQGISPVGECIVAKDKEDVLGFCLFTVTDKEIKIHEICPKDDVMMADGILRSALHVASERFIFKAYYDNDSLEEVINKLGFLKEKETREIDIDKLFRSCHGG